MTSTPSLVLAAERISLYVSAGRSLFDPQRLVELLAMPAGAEPVAMLCIGPVPDLGPA
jgi:hypothetical protein